MSALASQAACGTEGGIALAQVKAVMLEAASDD